MRIINNEIQFEKEDKFFLQRYGGSAAKEMFLRHREKTDAPFIRDVTQLCGCIGIRRTTLFKLLRSSKSNYEKITLYKKSGGTRKIYAPCATLKYVQQRILSQILRYMPVSRYATAYVEGRSLRENATPHIAKKYLLKMDITDFFGSITFQQVMSSAFNANYFPKHIGYILTSLCCKDDFLPQGAPTSPCLSNIVMKNFDEAIGSWCEERGISYSRYSDDLTFSADTKLFHVYEKVCSMLGEMGFEVNRKKTKFITNASRQSVTGIVVNEKTSIPREYKRKLRQEIFYVLKYGVEDCIIKREDVKYVEGHYIDWRRYLAQLQGKVEYVLGVEPDNAWFQKARADLRRVDIR